MIIKTSFTKAVAASMVILIGSVMGGAAATIVVTNANDSGAGSLRKAITQANANAQDDTINFSATFFNVARKITLASEIQITADGANPGRAVTINGPGANLLTISGNNVTRPFYFAAYSTIAMSGITIRDGNGVGTVFNNEGRSGGALLVGYQSGVTLTNVTLRNNTVANAGGGIYLNGARNLAVSGSIFTENNAGYGGALYDSQSNVKTLVNTTISNNAAINKVGGAYFDAFTTTISNCLITGNSAGADPNVVPAAGAGSIGGLGLQGTIATVTDTTISNNVAGRSPSSTFQGHEGVVGGVSVNTDSAIFRRVTVSGNTDYSGSYGGGAGMQLRSYGTLEVIDSVVSNNRHVAVQINGPRFTTSGGGIFVDGSAGGDISVINTTIAGNVAENGRGGGIYNSSTQLRVTNSTITGNVSEFKESRPEDSYNNGGGGIFNTSPPGFGQAITTIQNSIVAGNTGPTGPDVTGTFVSNGYNIVGNTANSTGFGKTGDQLNVNPLLDPNGPQDNGGATLTIALRPGSPAIDKGKSANVTTDQRGFLRPFDDPSIPNAAGGDGADIGAYEANALEPKTLGNISTRLRVETGDNVLIGGFIITGTQPKKVIIRAIGPSLPLAGKLANPTLELFGPGGLITSNDNWQESPKKQAIIDSKIPPKHPLEAAIVATLPAKNAGYTAIVRGAGGGTGIGLVEVYDLDDTVDSELANISSRGLVQTGDNVMIGGFIISGATSKKVIVRAIGPSLPVAGKLADPTLELFNGNGQRIAMNDNWRQTQEAQIKATGVAPTKDREAAIVATLPPGGTTAIVRGKGGTTGVALVEIYALQ